MNFLYAPILVGVIFMVKRVARNFYFLVENDTLSTPMFVAPNHYSEFKKGFIRIQMETQKKPSNDSIVGNGRIMAKQWI